LTNRRDIEVANITAIVQPLANSKSRYMPLGRPVILAQVIKLQLQSQRQSLKMMHKPQQ
jgi:hypothetical protein